MRFNALMTLGIFLLLIGGTIQYAQDITGPDTTPPEWDPNYSLPKNGATYTQLTDASFVCRDLESGIAQVILAIWPKMTGVVPAQNITLYNLAFAGRSTSSWETWTTNLSPQITRENEYGFQFKAINGKQDARYVLNTPTGSFTIQKQTQPTGNTGTIFLAFTVNGTQVQAAAYWTVTYPNTTVSQLTGNNILITNAVPGTYGIKATYAEQQKTSSVTVVQGQTSNVVFDFTTNNTQTEFPTEPEGSTGNQGLSLSTGGMLLIVGAVVLVMGVMKKPKRQKA